jgi:hypothetical protein
MEMLFSLTAGEFYVPEIFSMLYLVEIAESDVA